MTRLTLRLVALAVLIMMVPVPGASVLAQNAPAAAASGKGTVSSAHPKASEAGAQILRDGGSATDAALAMMLALTVVEPQSSGIGGGGFLVHHGGKTGMIDTIDGRETAPAAAKPDRFMAGDKPMGYLQAVPGGRSVGVPGNIRLMAMAHAKWGRLPWKALFQPAIKLAEEGFEVSVPLNNSLGFSSRLWKDFPETAAIYLDAEGKPKPAGTVIRNPALAALLRDIADKGPDAFYTGANAAAIVQAVTGSKLSPGDITLADIAAYQAKQRPAVCGHYRGYKVCSMGPPSSGATTVLQILGMVERFDLKGMGKESPQAWHVIAEAMRLAYADRETYLGDRDFVEVPVAGLIDPAYLKARSRLITPGKALGKYEAGMPPGAPMRTAAMQAEVPGTTHFVAVDGDGDIVSMTSTVEGPFGSQLVANGYILNNELTDFTWMPERDGAPVANRVEGGKRPLSSMSPTIVYAPDGTPVFTVGAAGGKTIIMQVAKAIIAHLDWGLPARDAIGEGLIYFNGAGLVLEQGTGREPLKPALEAMGHKVSVGRLGLKANAAERTPTGWVGAADPRSIGNAMLP